MRVRGEKCLQDYGDQTCEGAVRYRDSLSPSGKNFPRCEHHWTLRLIEQDRIVSLYGGDTAPADFDPGYAGEVW